MTISALVLGFLLLLIAPRAADAVFAQAHERFGPTIAIGIAIFIVLPVAAFIAAITLVGLPLAIGTGLALLPLAAIAYVTSAWALGRAIVKPPRERILAFLAGLAILRALALVPFLGVLVWLAAVMVGLGLIGAAIGAAREPAELVPSAAEHWDPRVARVLRLGAGAQAEREDRAAGVRDELLMLAGVAEPPLEATVEALPSSRGHGRSHRASRGPATAGCAPRLRPHREGPSEDLEVLVLRRMEVLGRSRALRRRRLPPPRAPPASRIGFRPTRGGELENLGHLPTVAMLRSRPILGASLDGSQETAGRKHVAAGADHQRPVGAAPRGRGRQRESRRGGGCARPRDRRCGRSARTRRSGGHRQVPAPEVARPSRRRKPGKAEPAASGRGPEASTSAQPSSRATREPRRRVSRAGGDTKRRLPGGGWPQPRSLSSARRCEAVDQRCFASG